MLNKNYRKQIMNAMGQIEHAADLISDLTEYSGADHLAKAQVAGELAQIYASLKDMNTLLLADVLLEKKEKEQV